MSPIWKLALCFTFFYSHTLHAEDLTRLRVGSTLEIYEAFFTFQGAEGTVIGKYEDHEVDFLVSIQCDALLAERNSLGDRYIASSSAYEVTEIAYREEHFRSFMMRGYMIKLEPIGLVPEEDRFTWLSCSKLVHKDWLPEETNFVDEDFDRLMEHKVYVNY